MTAIATGVFGRAIARADLGASLRVLGDALEDRRAALVLAGTSGALTGLVAIAAALRTGPAGIGPTLLLGVAAAGGLAIALARPPERLLWASCTTVLTIALLTLFAAGSFAAAPTVVWLYAFIIPAIGLVRGPGQGALAGLASAPALHWIETGVGVDLLDPQTPFGVLILVTLGAVPAQLLAVARYRRVALDAQLGRIRGLLAETEVARTAEAEARYQAVFMLARAAEARDGMTGAHLYNVRDLAGELARAAGLSGDDPERVAWSAMLHDVGKLRVPDRVLNKIGRLDEDDWALMRQHPAWGEQLLEGDESFALARQIARWHHENWDGTGYPDGLRGPEIPLPARIVRIVDVFDALRSERPYKPAWGSARVLEELRRMRGRALDPALTDLFVRLQRG